MKNLRGPAARQWIGFALIAAVLLTAPFWLSDFRLGLLGRFLAYAILAIGLDLIWGYTGILSLGHAVYFGLGAYCMGMHLKLVASGSSIPDFMSWSGLEQIPWWWKPFASPVVAMLACIVVPALAAGFLGYVTFRSRIRGVFFSILSQAVSIVMVTLFIGQQAYTGGTNGLTSFTTFLGYQLDDPGVHKGIYFATLLALGIVYFVCRWMINGRMGKILIAIRDGENRFRFIGYNPVLFKVFVYMLSAALAGLAGGFFVLQVGIISPSQMSITFSIGMVLWVAVGGRGTLVGPILGAILINSAENLLSEQYPATWSYAMGAMFVGTVLFLPQGVLGLLREAPARWNGRRSFNVSRSRVTGAESVAVADNTVH